MNAPRWEFGRLLGLYAVLFFLLAQIMARVRFGQAPTLPIVVGAAMIISGGLIIAVWGG